jgi:putative spermidine/putrescine transport system permease protein
MASVSTPAVAPELRKEPGARWRAFRSSALARHIGRWLGIVPFGVYVGLGLLVPTIAIAIKAFANYGQSGYTLANVKSAATGIYRTGYITDFKLSLAAAIIPGILGLLIAYAIFTAKRASVLRRVAITASGVFANFGGVPLAFLFIATLGPTGILTGWLNDIGKSVNPYNHGFTLFTANGVFLAYCYFQIPLMVLVILPALEGLRPAWREAAQNLGARTWQYWRHVGIPVLMPAILGCMLLLFGSSFSAYATAEAMTTGTIPLTPVQIGTLLNGNVLANPNVGNALSLGIIVVIAVLMILYTFLQRRAARWLR